MQDGKVWEKAGVAVSVVYGSMPVAALRTANPYVELPAQLPKGPHGVHGAQLLLGGILAVSRLAHCVFISGN